MAAPYDPNLFPWYPPQGTPKPPTPSFSLPPLNLGDLIGNLLQPPVRPVKSRIFASYQHSSDQAYYDAFSRIFHDGYETVYDNSLERLIDSDDNEYVMQRIRDEFITGTSCTFLLVGPTSYKRKFLDWEIKATLDKEHGLIGLQLPNLFPDWKGQVTVPTRFAENVRSGYALWIQWSALIAEPHAISRLIADACNRPKDRIVNRAEIMKRNG
jgi:MTH538 TIR-like domain (DUF1863)